tara:strand:- start:234 stop:467 length:234 start_codon:yes stop_codon:yes gene_type:complete
MEQYRCKKNFWTKFHSANRIVLKKNLWFSGHNENDVYSIIIPTNYASKIYTFDEDEFKEHFYTVDELRELEIDKVLT